MKADYSATDRLLHRLALASPATAEIFHDIERGLYLKKAPPEHGDHVFVCGLARAGTTILLRELHATGAFGSLVYGDMPFVLAPNLWARVSGKARQAFDPVERAHGDGIRVGLDSPEALDEVFWRIFHGKSYIAKDAMLPHRPGRAAIRKYREFIRLVLLHSGKRRYLTKANNNVLRLGALAEALPDSTFLLVLRDPLAHAASLLRQHRRFAGSDDRFRRDYMRWLAHHEFGVDHLPYRFPDAPSGGRDHVDYWLGAWLACYTALEAVAASQPNVCLVPYERMCADPAVWRAICARVGIASTERREIAAVEEPTSAVSPDAGLLARAQALHRRLEAQSARWLAAEPQAA